MNNLTRRSFLKAAGMAGLLGAGSQMLPGWKPRLAFASPRRRSASSDILINIFLRGGMDGLSAVVPYGEGGQYYDIRPTIAVPAPGDGARSALDLDGFFGLHPALAPLMDIYRQKDMAIVNASGLVHETRSHFDAQHFIEYGIPGDKTITTGWIGRYLASSAEAGDSTFRVVSVGDLMPDSLRGPVAPLSLRNINDFTLRGRDDALPAMQKMLGNLYATAGPDDLLNQQARLVFDSIAVMEKVTAEPYKPAHGATYPEEDAGEGFGPALQQVAQLIKADIGLEAVSLDLGGWDTHEAQGTLDGDFNDVIDVLGRALNAFYTDLEDRMNHIVIMVMSEFGRTIDENGSQGTDHGHGNAMFLLGGGVNGGKIYGSWPTLAPEARDDADDLAITTDYRHVVAEMLQKRLGNAAIDTIYPNFTPQPLGIFA